MSEPIDFDFRAARLELFEYIAPRCRILVERVLAAQGDAAEPELIQLQHELAELLDGPESLTDEEDQRERACIHTNTFSPFNQPA
jgi:hypothetical protein